MNLDNMKQWLGQYAAEDCNHLVRNASSFFGSCGHNGGWTSHKGFSRGVMTRCSTAKLPNKAVESSAGQHMEQGAWDVGAGNYFNFRGVVKTSGEEKPTDTFEPEEGELPPPVVEGPPVQCLVFGTIQHYLKHGWPIDRTTWPPKSTPPGDNAEAFKLIKEAYTNCNLIFLLREYPTEPTVNFVLDQTKEFRAFVDNIGWEIANESRTFHNRQHPTTGNTLRFFHIKVQD